MANLVETLCGSRSTAQYLTKLALRGGTTIAIKMMLLSGMVPLLEHLWWLFITFQVECLEVPPKCDGGEADTWTHSNLTPFIICKF